MRKPFIGILAFTVVLFSMPIGHAVMVLIEKLLGHDYQFIGAALLGLVGAALVWIGARSESEAKGTWYGLFGGLALWTGWVEFSFIWTANMLGVQPLIENGEIATKPEYLVMPSSIGLLLASMVYFLFNSKTKCGFFTWIQRNLRLRIADDSTIPRRNFSIITAMETIYILWFFYIVLLLVYDKNILGDRHPATYAVFFGSLVWSIYLIKKLIKFGKMPAAIRYSIPTVIIFWNAVEILGRWGFFEEVWVEPTKYIVEMVLISVAFIGVTFVSIVKSKRQLT